MAFAYIPTPMEYYNPTPVPPEIDTHHLTLDQVAEAVGATRCHESGLTGDGVTVAVIDTGLAQHPYFDQRGYKLMPMKDSPGGDASVDTDGHGTGVAANVLAVAPESTVMGVKGLAAESLEYCMDQKADVINCSWGWDVDYVDLMTFHEGKPQPLLGARRRRVRDPKSGTTPASSFCSPVETVTRWPPAVCRR